MNKPEAEAIAEAMSHLRPDWLRSSLVTMLGRHQHRTARDVALALVWVAYDPATKGPGRIDADGPWWGVTRTAGVNANATADPRCTKHGEHLPCMACERDTRGPLATPERIRELRTQHPIANAS